MKFSSVLTLLSAASVFAAPTDLETRDTDVTVSGSLSVTCGQAYDTCNSQGYKLCCPSGNYCKAMSSNDLNSYGSQPLTTWCPQPHKVPDHVVASLTLTISFSISLFGSCPNPLTQIPLSSCQPY
ncbi:hypothetical protein BT63DRAFT_423483 [Microthyrium microscopicum]|uniref:Hydrophobin n=1 Tax=Microthyrium microscopicum TaxID=703497 RepID=A0A6A6UII4_9PEZI|nr:hypothetical protein BT63DRAFT_423483 [Microthyrium microscopicum]